ncbi:polysaccharide biosynthesis protein [Marinobacter changyiensis]|uniref:polysaccharide biosynthesis protein n=1 Tax=Marinobacter changyiensis TaxID=2604091 RepID=UPI001FEA6096|nr:polysaccharide biosynthesis protein [Marinobacter changyiensis]
MTESKQNRNDGTETVPAGKKKTDKPSTGEIADLNHTPGDLPEKSESYWMKQKDRDNGGVVSYSEWDDSRLLVPSSLELGPGAVDKYVISKQIARMQEPRTLTCDDLDERRIIYPESPNRDLVNRFRSLRTQLLERSGGNNFTMVVSGASEGAGASFIALNLAAAFAFDEAKTALIIDCNLRDPALHSTLDIVPESGLTDFLDDPDYDIARILYPTGIPRLRLIPAGSRRETSSEFFTSFRMKQFLQAIRRRYPDRFIVLDTAPISDSPDARILTELCDYTLMVVPHGKITPGRVEELSMSFNQQKFVGTIING